VEDIEEREKFSRLKA